MDNYGPRTEALISFYHDLDQSFLLARLVSHNGKTEVNKLLQEALELQKGSGPIDGSKASELQKDAIRYLKLAQETTPNILFLFLMTKFEAYLEDIAVLICQESPMLIGVRAPGTEEEIRQKINGLFYRKRLNEIVGIFTTQLKIPFVKICTFGQGCTPRELDKAKAIRNIHIHSRGKVDPSFKNRIGDQSLKVGDYYPITMEYLNDLKDKIYCLVWGVDISATLLYSNIPRSTEYVSPYDFSD